MEISKYRKECSPLPRSTDDVRGGAGEHHVTSAGAGAVYGAATDVTTATDDGHDSLVITGSFGRCRLRMAGRLRPGGL